MKRQQLGKKQLQPLIIHHNFLNYLPWRIGWFSQLPQQLSLKWCTGVNCFVFKYYKWDLGVFKKKKKLNTRSGTKHEKQGNWQVKNKKVEFLQWKLQEVRTSFLFQRRCSVQPWAETALLQGWQCMGTSDRHSSYPNFPSHPFSTALLQAQTQTLGISAKSSRADSTGK